MNTQENYDEWTQEIITHCRDRNCKGMLLSHPCYHEYKCSDCGKYWMMNVEWVEVKAKAAPVGDPSRRLHISDKERMHGN